MKSTGPDPRRLDVAAVAAEGAELAGRWPLASMPRLAQDHPADAGTLTDDVVWRARGERRAVTGGEPEVWLHLDVDATVWRECQRCLRPVALPIRLERPLRFVRGEDAAAALDADSEDDVLELPAALDLRELVEDELLLALPLVPRHDRCPQPLPVQAAPEAAEEAAAPHPFAALASLKRDSNPH